LDAGAGVISGRKVMDGPSEANPWVMRSAVNNFYYLYQDAEWFLAIASKPEMEETFDKTRYCRTAIVLYVVALEALINRASEAFLPSPLREFFIKREDQLSFVDKWRLLPMLAGNGKEFEIAAYPWTHFVELVGVRNDFVHPKSDRMAYYRFIGPQQMEPLQWNRIPKDLGITEKEVVYRQTRIPRDPYSLRPEHLATVKRVVDDTVKELDRLLDGKIFKDNWAHTDQMKLIYPPGAQFTTPEPKTS